MDIRTAACLDVYYSIGLARVCNVVFQVPQENILSEDCQTIHGVQDYVPGEFYRRELPCLLESFASITGAVDLIIIDGYVWLNQGKSGLGAHLHKALARKTPVIGVAKTYYHGCEQYQEVFRGKSSKPLYVSSIGLELDRAAALVKKLQGRYRIPDVLRRVDHLTRAGR